VARKHSVIHMYHPKGKKRRRLYCSKLWNIPYGVLDYMYFPKRSVFV